MSFQLMRPTLMRPTRGSFSWPTNAPGPRTLLAHERDWVFITCNRTDFLRLATTDAHHGILMVIRRRTRAAERTALFELLGRDDETGIRNNINFS